MADPESILREWRKTDRKSSSRGRARSPLRSMLEQLYPELSKDPPRTSEDFRALCTIFARHGLECAPSALRSAWVRVTAEKQKSRPVGGRSFNERPSGRTAAAVSGVANSDDPISLIPAKPRNS